MALTAISEEVLAAASGSTAGLGKIGTVAATATLFVRLDCGRSIDKVDWRVKCNKAHAVQLYKAYTNVTSGTITFTDATAVDDEDSFVLNGLTYIAEVTEAQVDITNREWLHASQAGGAAALAVLLAHPTYGVPGIGSITVAAVDATDVLTISGGKAPLYQFAQGTSAANEIAWAETTKAGLVAQGAATTAIADNSATAGTLYEQWIDGWPYAYLGITNSDESNAATVTVAATKYA